MSYSCHPELVEFDLEAFRLLKSCTLPAKKEFKIDLKGGRYINLDKNIDSIVMQLWGKSSPYHPLFCHMLDVGCMMEALLKESVFSNILSKLSVLFNIDQEELAKLIVFLTTEHDIGKCHPLFLQKQRDFPIVQELDLEHTLQPGDTRNYRHEEFALLWICNLLKDKFHWEISPARLMGQIMASHHQHPRGTDPFGCIDKKEWWNALQERLTDILYQTVSPPQVTCNLCSHHDIAGTLLLSLVILSDWIASNTDFFPPANQINNPKEYLETSREYAKRAIERLEFQHSTLFEDIPADFCSIWPGISRDNMRALQTSCESLIKSEEISPGLLIIEAPMGEGKTEAALYVALQWMRMEGLEGVYTALPTAATSNQMFGRIKKLLDDLNYTSSVRLLHGMAWLLDDVTPVHEPTLSGENRTSINGKTDSEIAAEWFRPVKRGLLTPWAVGTVDQAMMAALKVRYGVLRWAGLSGKVLLLDEVHAYDTYMVTIIERLLSWCGVLNIPVILLSATLPSEMRRKLMTAYTGNSVASEYDEGDSAYPLITHSDSQGRIRHFSVPDVHVHRKVKITMDSFLGEWEKVAKDAIQMIENGGCLCIIVNTVGDAQSLYREVKRLAKPDIDLKLFHARFKAGRRKEIEEDCLRCYDKRSLHPNGLNSRPKKSILIATQVVEQSLDLDFDIMISAIAPIDLLFQRLGRLHRHDGRIRPDHLKGPVFQILIPIEEGGFGSTAKVYEPWILHQTMAVLNGRNCLSVPEDIRELIEFVYSTSEPEKVHPYYQDWEQLNKNREEERNAALKYLIPTPRSRYFWMSNDENHSFNEDEDGGKWFSAKTRLGDNTRNVLLIDETEVLQIKDRMKSLTRFEAQELLKNLVSLPSYAVDGIQPMDGFSGPIKGQGMLGGNIIIPIRENKYCFVKDEKYQYEIIDDYELGVKVEREG